MSECCKTGFQWEGKPIGKESTLGNVKTYVSGSNKDAAVLMVHDIFGWTLPNNRLLADHFAKEADVTCYLPDFFDGEVVAPETMDDPKKREALNLMAFFGRHSKDICQPEIFACVEALKQEHGFKTIGAIGHCWGAWAVARLGAKGKNLVDCISMAHPSLLEKAEIDALGVPVQISAPETDPMFTPELKEYVNKVIPTLNIDYAYQYFPGLTHGFAVRGDPNNPLQRRGLERAKNADVSWFREYLHPHSL